MACCNSSKTSPPNRSSKPRDKQLAVQPNSADQYLAISRSLRLALLQEEFAYLRRAARLVDDTARLKPRLVAFATLLLFRLAAAAFRVLRTADLLLRASLLPSRSTIWTALLRARTFCAALAFAAMVPSAVPIDSAKLVKRAASFLCLRACVFIAGSFLFSKCLALPLMGRLVLQVC